jgi:hypothetical protein
LIYRDIYHTHLFSVLLFLGYLFHFEFDTLSDCFSAMKDNRQRSSRVLLALILVMYIGQSAGTAVNWYCGWLAFVKYSGSPDQAAAIFWPSEETPLTVLKMTAVIYLIAALRIGIADSILVSYLRFWVFSNSNQLPQPLRSGDVGSSVIVAGEQ